MNYLKSTLSRLKNEESGQSLIEYSLIAGIVAVGAIMAMVYLRLQIAAVFNMITQSISNTNHL